MNTIPLTVNVPENLLERAAEMRVSLDDITITRMIEAELVRVEAANTLRDAMKRLQGSMSPDEIEAELDAAKRERMSGKA